MNSRQHDCGSNTGSFVQDPDLWYPLKKSTQHESCEFKFYSGSC